MNRVSAWHRGAAVVALVAMASVVGGNVVAQTGGSSTPFYGSSFAATQPGEKMLVQSDQLVYDYDRHTVSAVDNVRIYYGGYTLQADRVTYNQVTGRLIASGHVKLTDPTGAIGKSDYVDITDDFRDGFVQSLRVDTPQQTHFTAERAERQGGVTTTFVNGSYTACEPCAEHPEKPPLWNVRAAKIVVNQQEHMVYFTDAKLEFFGLPVAWLPYFAIPDPTVKRKSGFLLPSSSYSARLGFGGSLPYFWALAPNRDLTFTPTVYSRQGFLGEVEWRHRLVNGQYSLKMAGIDQLNKDAFRTTSPSYRDFRGGIRTTGEFYINRDWTLGWDGTLSTDRTFTRDYHILNTDTSDTTSTIHLTGLGDRNFFEARASYFQILTDQSAPGLLQPERYNQGRQGTVLPVVDYERISDRMPFGGELRLTSNVTAITRNEDDTFNVLGDPNTYYHGTAGTTARATQEVSWQRQMVGPAGQVVTPFASIRGDVFYLDGQSATAIGDGLTSASTAFSVLPTAGLEWSLPLLVQSAEATQIFEPKAQLVLRPNGMRTSELPNNDAQSLVFEDSNLFDRDKSSGYDLRETGGRLNVGLHYNGMFANGASIDGTFGQSFQLFGYNAFADFSNEIADVGRSSGLETRRSDFVGAIAIDSGVGPRLSLRGRFDEKTFAINRAEVEATTALGPVTASAAYFYLRDNPNGDAASPTMPASVVHGAASLNLAENWRAFGSFAYDLASSSIASNSFGIAFDNECLTLSIAYSQTRESFTDLSPDRWVNVRLQLRTLGEGNTNANLSSLN